jgi:hypothetical protein
MSLEAEVAHTVKVVNLTHALLRAQNFDRVNCACGVAIMATVLAGQDRAARAALANTMFKLAHELDPDLLGARWQ